MLNVNWIYLEQIQTPTLKPHYHVLWRQIWFMLKCKLDFLRTNPDTKPQTTLPCSVKTELTYAECKLDLFRTNPDTNPQTTLSGDRDDDDKVDKFIQERPLFSYYCVPALDARCCYRNNDVNIFILYTMVISYTGNACRRDSRSYGNARAEMTCQLRNIIHLHLENKKLEQPFCDVLRIEIWTVNISKIGVYKTTLTLGFAT